MKYRCLCSGNESLRSMNYTGKPVYEIRPVGRMNYRLRRCESVA